MHLPAPPPCTRSGYAYLAFIMNASITYAFYWLAMFYLALKKELGARPPAPPAPLSPLPPPAPR